MRITEESIKGLEVEDLMNFIAANLYKSINENFLDSQDFQKLPTYLKYFIYIIDFETEYEMSGLLTLLMNSTGKYLAEIAESFVATGNIDIASLLLDVNNVLIKNSLSAGELSDNVNQLQLYDIVTIGKIYSNNSIVESLSEIDNKLSDLICRKVFWTNVENYLQREIKKERK